MEMTDEQRRRAYRGKMRWANVRATREAYDQRRALVVRFKLSGKTLLASSMMKAIQQHKVKPMKYIRGTGFKL